MPRDAHSAAKAVDMLDLLIEFFDDGERWIKGKLDDGAGNRCLVGALRDIRDGHNLHGAPTRVYLLKAMQRSPKTGWTGLISFNDRCRDFGELREVILQARKLTVADIEKHQRAAILPCALGSSQNSRVTFPPIPGTQRARHSRLSGGRRRG